MAAIPIRKTVNHGVTKFLVDLRSLGGGRYYFDSKTEAAQFVEQKQAEHQQFGAAAFRLSQEQRTEFIQISDELKELGATLRDAFLFYKQHHRKIEPTPIGEAIQTFLDIKRAAGKADRYVRQLGYNLRPLAIALGETRKVHAIATSEIERFLRNPDWSLETVKTKSCDVRTFFAWCVKRNLALTDPTLGLEKIEVAERRPGILTPDQVARLMQVARASHPRTVPYFALAIFAGIRPEEIRRLDWKAVHLDHSGHAYVEIDARRAKTRQRRLVHLQPNAVAWLRLGGELPLINWRKRFDKVREQAGFAVFEGDPGEPWPQDCMRHSAASYLLPVLGAAQTALNLGHSESILYARYREIVKPEEAKRFWQIAP